MSSMWASTDLFSAREISLLIELVQAFPVLYAADKKTFKQVIPKEKAWTVIATKLNRTVNECEKKWRYMRDKYVKERRRLAEEAQANDSTYIKSNWQYYEAMNFLDHHIVRKPNEGKLSQSFDDGSMDMCDHMTTSAHSDEGQGDVEQSHSNSPLSLTNQLSRSSTPLSHASSGAIQSTAENKEIKISQSTTTVAPPPSDTNVQKLSDPKKTAQQQIQSPITHPGFNGIHPGMIPPFYSRMAATAAMARQHQDINSMIPSPPFGVPPWISMWSNAHASMPVHRSEPQRPALRSTGEAQQSNNHEKTTLSVNGSSTIAPNVSGSGVTETPTDASCKKRKRKLENDININLAVLDKDVNQLRSCEKHAEYHFCLSLAQMMEEVPKQARAGLKIKLMQEVIGACKADYHS